MDKPIQTVLIYGYGVMGRGVAKTFADSGFTTVMKSGRAGMLTGLPANSAAVERLPEEAPDLVIEFVPEDVRVKQSVYAEVEAAYPENTPLIASGTSGLDLVELARRMKRPERFLGVHYFMPADTAPVVEVMAGLATPRADVDRVADALKRTGKEPVVHPAERHQRPQDPRRRSGVDRAAPFSQCDAQPDAAKHGPPRPDRALGRQGLLRLGRVRRRGGAQASLEPTRKAARVSQERDRCTGARDAAENGFEVISGAS